FGSKEFWMKKGISYAIGLGYIEDLLLTGLTFGRKQSNPTVRHIPFFLPNAERKFFTTIKDFRFDDGGAFDFRGNPERSAGNKSNMLANSNERGNKGFITTYQVNRPVLFIGKYKLDWLFVKPAKLSNPTNSSESFRFAPHFGRTLTAVNEMIEDRISDHRPMIVDLPLEEPPLDQRRTKRKQL
ncbi:MAG TPA: hypothetical protein VEX64_02960, partial [Pyrinomonadaceae bacterium]|nr:hypothetical protein [Pyrinomonadaceae bacterium]